MDKQSQCQAVLDHLKQGPLDAIQALRKIGTARLAARILDLKKQGHTIVTEMVSKRGKRFAVYHLIGEKK